ncbi:MAG: hypothetical protein IJE40_04045 [Clostridia bacterium]|nr:hypothetical protein [Clostridia bacterium]
MKRLVALLLALIMGLSMVACGGPDKQPAIDAFNHAKDSFNEVAAVINSDPASYAQEVIDTMVEMANLLQEHGEVLSGDQEITEEQLDEMIAWYADVEDWVADVKAELGME